MARDLGAGERVRAIGREVRVEAAALAADWAAQDDAALEVPSACAGWAVRDVAAHLTQGAERAVVVVQHALAGTPPPDFPPAVRLARVRELRTWSGPALAASFQRDVDAAFRLLEGADDAALATVVQVPAGPHTLVQFATQRLSEAALHGWDIRAPRDPAATLRPEAAALFVDYLMARVPRMTSAEAARGLDRTYHCELTGPGGGPVTLTIRDGGGTATRGAPAVSDGILTLPVEAFIRLVWGRLDIGRALDEGTLRYSGGRDEALALRALFPGH